MGAGVEIWLREEEGEEEEEMVVFGGREVEMT